MKVSKSAVYKLDVESTCGCKVSGEFKDSIYKQVVGEPVFSSCEKHKPLEEDFKVLMREVFDKEVKEAQDAPPPMTLGSQESVHPRTAARLAALTPSTEGETQQPAAEGQPQAGPVVRGPSSPNAASGPPIRTLRTNGSNGSAGKPVAAAAGSHRPAPRQGGGMFHRAEAGGAALSVHAQAAISKTASSVSGIVMGGCDIGEEVPEDTRITRFVESIGLCNDPNDPDDGDDLLGED